MTQRKAAFFDMDGTLIKEISWRVAHDEFGVDNSENVEAFENGEISSSEFMAKDFGLWMEKEEEITVSHLEEAVCHLNPRRGAEKLIGEMREKNYVKIAIVSGGLKLVAEKLMHQLDLDDVLANGFITFTKNVEKEIKEVLISPEYKYNFSRKDELIEDLAENYGIPLEQTLAVGDSKFDIPMFKVAGTGIAFHPKDEEVEEVADKTVEDGDLTELIEYI